MIAIAPHINFEMQPGTGKAVEVRRNDILRIEQVLGGQCVDFNCFNLHDYKERLHVGRTRTANGLHPTTGSYLWSAPPRERRMMMILKDTAGCNDTLFPGCSAALYESRFGFVQHTNCHDIQSEAQREYGLTPDDVHDSFNFFMKTSVSSDDRAIIERQTTKAGDFVELLACMDVLAVPNICGDDVMLNNNFSLKPVSISVRRASPEECGLIETLPRLQSQRSPANFRNNRIKCDRELQRDLAYTPNFINTPITYDNLMVDLDTEDIARFLSMRQGQVYGNDDGAALRDILLTWATGLSCRTT